MQSKGTLGSIVAGVIAIFLVIVCLFYLSFTVASNRFEEKANAAALKVAGPNNPDEYEKAYTNYLLENGKDPIWLGYNYNETQQWGVGLGLDLKGGMNVILQVDMPDILRSMKNKIPDTSFDQALAATDTIVNRKHQSEDYVSTFVKEYRRLNRNADYSMVFQDVKGINKGMDDNAVAAILKQEVQDRVNNSATNVLRNRIDAFGVVSPNIQVLQGKDGQILLELPGVKDHQRVRELLQRAANLEFYTSFKESGAQVMQSFYALDAKLKETPGFGGKGISEFFVQGGDGVYTAGVVARKDTAEVARRINSAIAKATLPGDLRLLWGVKPASKKDMERMAQSGLKIDQKQEYFTLYPLKTVNGKAALDGDVVVAASQEYDDRTHQATVSMSMDSEGARQWGQLTRDNINFPVAIVLDNKVYSNPRVNDAIENGTSSISGDFTIQEAQDLANVLKSGKMNARVHIISDMVIGPSLGQQAIQAGIWSFIVALVLLMIFMMMFYGVIPGLVANFGLICNLFFTFGILASFQAVLTLSGIAGIVLALGMAVDANVLIFERAKEELRAGKNIRAAIADGYSNAFSAIFDSNLTSVITGVILLYFGTGPIKGFATTLIIGIVCSFFTAVYLTRLIFIMGAKAKPFQNLTFTTPLSRRMFENTQFNFLGKRTISFTVVGIFVLVSVISLFTKSLNQGIDFSGGRNYIVKLAPADDKDLMKPAEIQAKLAEVFQAKEAQASISVINIENSNQVRISTNYKIDSDEDATAIEDEIKRTIFEQLASQFPGMDYKTFDTSDENNGILQSQTVGPTVANDMRAAAYIAVILSLIAMFLYILIRFRNIAFSVGALAAVVFTAFAIIGLYSLLWGILPFAMEIDQTFIAAILTVIGYQINDTVVVFDRVRENVGLYPKQDFFTTINKSLNSTLGRTVMTSASTLLVLLCIFILGGDALRSFVFAMICGVIIGTLATMFIAAPVAYLTDSRKKNAKATAPAKA